MSYIPSYYHLSQPQIRDLTFHVNLRCVRNGGDSTDANTNNEIVEDNDVGDTNRCLISKEISWQEKIPGPCDVGLPSDLEECASKGQSGV